MSVEENGDSFENATSAPASPSEPAEASADVGESTEVGDLLESMETLTPLVQGEIVRAKVLKVTGDEVLVDVGLKCEAAIPLADFTTEQGQKTVAAGDEIDIWIEQYDESAGTVSASYRRAAHVKAWDEVGRAFEENRAVKGQVIERTKGGLTVDIGVRAFLPGSQADIRPHPNLDVLVGQETVFKVIKFNKKRKNVVVSRKAALEEEANRKKTELIGRLVEGAELAGRVKNLTDYGAFVDLGGLDGLLHITDLSWARIGHPSEVVQVGQEIKVKVLKFDSEKERVSLGLKQLAPDPWERVPATYHPGDRLIGHVVSVTDYGAFVELEPGIEGLIHISEMTWSKRLRHPSKIVNKGDRVEVSVLDVNAPQRRISLSLRQTLPDPWETLPERLKVGDTVQGRVRNLTDFGAFVEVEEGVEGLVHLSNFSWTRKIKHPSEVLRKGQRVDATVLSLDAPARRLSLGIKQLQPDVWQDFFSKAKVDDIVRGKVSRQVPFGAFVELQEGIEGLCHISEFGEGADGKSPPQLEVGSEHSFRVIRLNPEERKIGLSLKEVNRPAAAREEPKEKEPERISTMAQALSSAGVTLPDPASTPPAAEPERGTGAGNL
jgi:small subunit ribosomal protein S1